MGLLFKHHCTAKDKKTCSHFHLDWRERKALDQDRGYIPRRRKSPRDNGYLLGRPNGTKILKALDEHGEALKKMEGCLTSLEESSLNKSTHEEVHDKEEEVEEWDE